MLIKEEKCIYCGGRIEKSDFPEISKDNVSRIVSEIFHCGNPKCRKTFYVPNSIYDTIQKTPR
jgi:uncharacterized protein with PIN domain